jgi:hypothetical protein
MTERESHRSIAMIVAKGLTVFGAIVIAGWAVGMIATLLGVVP